MPNIALTFTATELTAIEGARAAHNADDPSSPLNTNEDFLKAHLGNSLARWGKQHVGEVGQLREDNIRLVRERDAAVRRQQELETQIGR